MKVKTFFIETPSSWDAVTASLIGLSQGRAKTVSFVGTVAELAEASEAIGVVVMSVSGMADFAVEIYADGLLDLPSDTMGMHLAGSIKANVLVPDDIAGPPWWVLLRPDGTIDHVLLDAEKLNHAQVEYRVAAPGDVT